MAGDSTRGCGKLHVRRIAPGRALNREEIIGPSDDPGGHVDDVCPAAIVILSEPMLVKRDQPAVRRDSDVTQIAARHMQEMSLWKFQTVDRAVVHDHGELFAIRSPVRFAHAVSYGAWTTIEILHRRQLTGEQAVTEVLR